MCYQIVVLLLLLLSFFLNLLMCHFISEEADLESQPGSCVTLDKLFKLFGAQCPKLKNKGSNTYCIRMLKRFGETMYIEHLAQCLAKMESEKMESQRSSPILLSQMEFTFKTQINSTAFGS